MSNEVEFEIDGFTYEVEAERFSPPEGGYRWGEPPDTGELELNTIVIRVPDSDLPYNKRPRERISLAQFVEVYADHHDIQKMDPEDRHAAAEAQLEDEVWKILLERLEDDFDDRDI